MLDIKIINATLVDGTGEKPYAADLGIVGDQIVSIGNLQDAESKLVIDAAGKCLAPGFIDMHTHSDLSMVLDDTADSMLRNGVTTNVCGNCGEGVVPFSPEYRSVMTNYIRSSVIPARYPKDFDFPWSTFAEYHDYVRKHPPLINMASLIPHGPIRMCVKGMDEGDATPEQIATMCQLVEESMEAGAFGISTGLAALFTPILSSALMSAVGDWVLFPYACGFIFLSFCCMLFVRHGDAKPTEKKSTLEMLDVED